MNDIRAEIEFQLGKPELDKKIDLSSIRKELITSPEQFQEILESDDSDMVGFDIETTSKDYPRASFSGFSVFFPNSKLSIYVPFLHITGEELHDYCVPRGLIQPHIAKLIKEKVLVFHYGVFDIPFLMRSGFLYDINNIVDTWVVGVMFQCPNLALKDLVLEYGLVGFDKVLKYRDLIKEVKNLTEEQLKEIENFSDEKLMDAFSFSTIDMKKFPLALEYACNDSIFTYYLWEELYDKYDAWIGNTEQTNLILKAQMDTLIMLAKTSATGNFFDENILREFKEVFEREVSTQEAVLKNEVRVAMDWG